MWSWSILRKKFTKLSFAHCNLLVYALSVWDPYLQKNIAKTEAVQRRVVRFILSRFRNTSSVNSMLEALGWPTLEQRQTCRLLILYKIQSGLAHCPTLKAKLVPLPSHQWHAHDKQFTLLTTRTVTVLSITEAPPSSQKTSETWTHYPW